MWPMNHNSETRQLAESVTNLAKTITAFIESKIRELAPTPNTGADETANGGKSLLAPAEGWVGKKHVAQHFNVSVRTVDNWMNKGLIPYIRIGRSLRLKLSDVDEAMNRRVRIASRY